MGWRPNPKTSILGVQGESLGLEQDLIYSPNGLRFWASHYPVTLGQWAINQMVIYVFVCVCVCLFLYWHLRSHCNAILGVVFHVPLLLQFLNALRKILRRNVDALDVAVNKLLHIP